MNEMIERVAKAIHRAAWNESVGWRHREQEEAQRAAREMARAAIQAMREPTEAMIEAPAISDIADAEGARPAYIWDAMINEALK